MRRLGLAGGLLVACTPGTSALESLDAVAGDGARADDAAPAEVPGTPPPGLQVPWATVRTVAVSDFGASERFTVPYPEGLRYLAVRVEPEDVGASDDRLPLCYRLEPVLLGHGDEVVGPTARQAQGAVCTACEQRVSVGEGAGVFVFSSSAQPIDEAGTLEASVQVYDCALQLPASRATHPGLPQRLRIDAAWEPAPEPDERLELAVRVAVTPGSWLHGRTSEAAPFIDDLWETASERFARAGIRVHVETTAEVDWPPAGEPLEFGPGSPASLERLQADALARLSAGPEDRRFVLVVFAGCLQWSNPALGLRSHPFGQTTRIPGDLSLAPAASLVVLATGECGGISDTPPWTAATGGVIAAHELGHYLGLYHSDEPAGRPLAGDAGERLMVAHPTDVDPRNAWLSPGERAVAVRHPAIRARAR